MTSSAVLDPPGQVASFDERVERLAVVAGQVNVLHAEMVDLVAATTDSDLGGGGYRSRSHFATHRLGLSAGRAQAVARIGERFADLPVCGAAFRAGRMSLDQMDVIARLAPAHHDEEACELAEVMSPAQLSHLFSKHRRAEETTPEDEERKDAKRRATTFWDDDGDLVLSARLDPQAGSTVDTALTAHRDAMWNEWKTAKSAAEKAGEPFSAPEPTVVDALVRMADRSLTAEAADRPHHKRLQALLHVDVDQPGSWWHLGPAVGDDVRRWLTCDATYRILFEKEGKAIGIGRTSRTIPHRTRVVVEDRDGGCRVPGCAARYVQIHHIQHWEHQGETETHNLMALCPHHHRAHHEKRLGIHGANADDPHGITFTNARNQPLPGHSPPATPTGPVTCTAEPYVCPDGGRADYCWLALPDPPRPPDTSEPD